LPVCNVKSSWLRSHRPELAQPPEFPLALTGRVVERQARELFPGIVQVSRDALGNTLVVQTATLPGTVVWLDPCRAGYGRAGSPAQ